MTAVPGAAMLGFTMPVVAGPRLEKGDIILVLVIDPTPMARGRSPGELAVLHAAPIAFLIKII